MMRDLLTSGGRAAALVEAQQRTESLRSVAGTSSRTLTPTVRPSSDRSRSRGPQSSDASVRRSCTAGPSAPAPQGWTQRTGASSVGPASSSIQAGPQGDGGQSKSARALGRRRQQDGRDPIALESGLSFCEERAIRPQSTPGYQRAFLLLLTFLATLGTWPLTQGNVSPSDYKKVSLARPEQLDASLCDYFDSLYFSGSMSHEAEKAKAAAMHYVPTLIASMDLPRMTRALQGFRKIAPGSSRYPLPWGILGALLGWLTSGGHHEMALALLVMFVCYLRPSELFMIRVCDISQRRGVWTIILAASDSGLLTKTGQQDEGVLLTNQIFSRLGDAMEAHLNDMGST